MLFPFLLGILHRYGYFEWIKQEWLTFKYWKNYFWTQTDEQKEKNDSTKDVKTIDGGGQSNGSSSCCGCNGKESYDEGSNKKAGYEEDVLEEKKKIR